jgi:catechol 2,3-dioxygenase-like lactoylglutathione lyase family enzyme
VPEATQRAQEEIMRETLGRRSALGATATFFVTLAATATGRDDEAPIYGQGLLVQLRVKDLDRSIRFYTGLLGFRVTERRDDLQFVHLDCGVEHLQIGLSAGGAEPPSAGSVVLNFNVAGDVDAVRARLEARGVSFTGPTLVIPGKVRLADFSDPDGYRLRLAGEDSPGT